MIGVYVKGTFLLKQCVCVCVHVEKAKEGLAYPSEDLIKLLI